MSIKREQLTILIDEYNSTITEYENAYQNFIELNNNNRNLYKLANSKIEGTPYNTLNTNTINSCISNCNNNNNCSGLDYNNSSNICKVFNNNTLSIVTNNNHTSYIKNINLVSLKISEINNRLNNIVAQINTLLNDIEPKTIDENNEKNNKITELNIEYNKLEEKNNRIKNLIKQNNSLTNEYNTTSIMINKSVFTYFIWILLLLILLFFIIKYVFYS